MSSDQDQEKIVGVKLSYESCGGWCFFELKEDGAGILEELRNAAENDMMGEKIILELCEYTRKEIDNMPEFQGW